MSICSEHRTPVADCPACQAMPSDLFPDWDQKVAEAKAVGKYTCQNCGFIFYKTTNRCPKCYAMRIDSYETDSSVR